MTPHACNNPLTCPCCIKRFWQWAESHTRGRTPKRSGPYSDSYSAPSFYEAAAKFIDVDARAHR